METCVRIRECLKMKTLVINFFVNENQLIGPLKEIKY